MENINRTLYGSYLQTCKLLDRPFVLEPNTTLNEKFGIQAGVLPDINAMPAMRYFALGDGGHTMGVGANGRVKVVPLQHCTDHAALYNHKPFVLRQMANDLGPADRAKYGLRRQETHGGLQYVAYYLRRLDLSAVIPAMLRVSVVDGVETTSAFVANSSNLNPTPPDLSPSGVLTTTGEYVSASAQMAMLLDDNDIAELLEVSRILDDDEGYANISEIALVSGVDKIVSSPAVGGATINFNEVIAAQVVSFINVFWALGFNSEMVSELLDVGATEPLLKLT